MSDNFSGIVGSVRQLCGKLILECDRCPNLDLIGRKSRELIKRSLSEFLGEIQEQGSKILTAIKQSRSIYNKVLLLQSHLQTIQTFLVDLNKYSIPYLSKRKLKSKLQEHAASLNSQRQGMLSSVTMLLLSQPSARMQTIGTKPTMHIDKHYHTTISQQTAPLNSTSASIDIPILNNVEVLVTQEEVKKTEEDLDDHNDVTYPHMLYSAGYMYYYGIGLKSRNFYLAFSKFHEAASVGDADSSYMVYLCYLNGNGVKKNYSSALKWLLVSVRTANSAAAKKDFALLLLDEVSRLNSDEIKKKLFNSDQQQDEVEGILKRYFNNLHNIHTTEMDQSDRQIMYMKEACNLLKYSAYAGCVEAHTIIGECYEDVYFGQKYGSAVNLSHIFRSDGESDHIFSYQGIEAAFQWFTRASHEGCPRASVRLGLLYYHGHNTERKTSDELWELCADHVTALNLFKMAAEAGNVEANYWAGLSLERGIENNENHLNNASAAEEHYKEGASKGNIECMYSYGYILVRSAVDLMSSLNMNQAIELSDADSRSYNDRTRKGIFWLRNAANAGHSDACYQLGRALEQGVGVPQDFHAAYEMYQIACNSSSENSNDKFYAHAAYRAANLLYGGLGFGEPNSQDFYAAFELYQRASHHNSGAAMNAYALCLEDGRAYNQYLDSLTSSRAFSGKSCLKFIPLVVTAAMYYYSAARFGKWDHGDAELEGRSSAILNLAHLLATGVIPNKIPAGLPHLERFSHEKINGPFECNDDFISIIEILSWMKGAFLLLFPAGSGSGKPEKKTFDEEFHRATDKCSSKDLVLYFNGLINHIDHMPLREWDVSDAQTYEAIQRMKHTSSESVKVKMEPLDPDFENIISHNEMTSTSQYRGTKFKELDKFKGIKLKSKSIDLTTRTQVGEFDNLDDQDKSMLNKVDVQATFVQDHNITSKKIDTTLKEEEKAQQGVTTTFSHEKMENHSLDIKTNRKSNITLESLESKESKDNSIIKKQTAHFQYSESETEVDDEFDF